MRLSGGLRFDRIESSTPAMEGAVTQNYGVLSYGNSLRVNAIEMRGTYYTIEPLTLAAKDHLRVAQRIARVKIVDIHQMAFTGQAFQGMAGSDLSETEADQLNAMRTLLIQSETKQNVSVWSKIKRVNDSIASMPGFSSLGSVVDRYGPMLDDPSIATVGMFVASIASLFTPLSLYGLATDTAEFFEGLF